VREEITTHRAPKDVLVAVIVYNEGSRVESVLSKFSTLSAYDVVVVDDGSDEDTSNFISRFDFPVLRHARNMGVGFSIKDAIRYGIEKGYPFLVVMAGNGKMNPLEIPQLLEPLKTDECEYVQGSRYLKGGTHENLPLFRNLMIKTFTWIVRALTGFKGTDVTCGFRAYKLSLFSNRHINIWQEWLDRYELEYYIHYNVIKLGYRIREVPVSMNYPRDGRPYSKIKPFSGWWSMIKPWVFLTLRIRR
jgi:dolichol-phosphate mannosyltransferase